MVSSRSLALQRRICPSLLYLLVCSLSLSLSLSFSRIKFIYLTKLTSGDFVNPGSRPPPIADPRLYFFFAKPNFLYQQGGILQREEFIGDRIYGESLLQVLEQWRFPRRCISMLYFAFASNAYQEKLYHKWKIPEFLVDNGGKPLIGKPCADAVEVSNVDTFHFSSKWCV